MKLLLCKVCAGIVCPSYDKPRQCFCGNIEARYTDDGASVGFTASSRDSVQTLVIDNVRLVRAVRKFPGGLAHMRLILTDDSTSKVFYLGPDPHRSPPNPYEYKWQSTNGEYLPACVFFGWHPK